MDGVKQKALLGAQLLDYNRPHKRRILLEKTSTIWTIEIGPGRCGFPAAWQMIIPDRTIHG